MPGSPGLTAQWGVEEWAPVLIEALAAEAVLLRAGANRITTTGRAVHVPRLLVHPRADWTEELRALPSDEGEADTLDLAPFKLGNVVTLSNESIADSSVGELDRVGAAMVRGVAVSLDSTAFSAARAAANRSPAGLLDYELPNGEVERVTISAVVRAAGSIVGAGGVPNAVIVSPEDLTSLRLEALTGAYATLADPTAPGIERIAGAALYPTPAFRAGTALIADMRYVAVAVRRDATAEFSPDAGFGSDATLARVVMRVDYAPSDVSALYLLRPRRGI